MTTTSSTPTPFQSLEEQPRQFFAEFERQVYDDAGSSCLDIFPHGLLSFVVSTSIWNNFPDNNIIVDGVPTIRARNSLLPPLQPADNAVAGLWKAFEARSKAYDKFESALALLLRRMAELGLGQRTRAKCGAGDDDERIRFTRTTDKVKVKVILTRKES